MPPAPRGAARSRPVLTRAPAPAGGLPRAVEIALAAAGLLVTAPLLVLSAGAVVLTSGRPALYRQRRVGRGGRLFTLVKFRTMRPSSGGPQITRRGDDRVTPVGRVLRRTKLDELPELWNVLRGDMSFVGPRPEVERFVQPDDPRWREILRVRPGLTDPVTLSLRDEERILAAVAGDPEAYYRETLQPLKLAGYVEYLRRRTWKTDLVVICDTLRALVVPSQARPPIRPDGGRA